MGQVRAQKPPFLPETIFALARVYRIQVPQSCQVHLLACWVVLSACILSHLVSVIIAFRVLELFLYTRGAWHHLFFTAGIS